MLRPLTRLTLALCGALLALPGSPLRAQGTVLGTFRWQLQPFCNIVTVNLIQQGAVFTLTDLDKARAEAGSGNDATQGWVIEPSHVGMGVGGSELKASVFQATNAIFIVTFGLIFTAFWGFFGKRGLEPSTPATFGLGLLPAGIGAGPAPGRGALRGRAPHDPVGAPLRQPGVRPGARQPRRNRPPARRVVARRDDEQHRPTAIDAGRQLLERPPGLLDR